MKEYISTTAARVSRWWAVGLGFRRSRRLRGQRDCHAHSAGRGLGRGRDKPPTAEGGRGGLPKVDEVDCASSQRADASYPNGQWATKWRGLAQRAQENGGPVEA
eukprot:EG_transcript_28650